MASWIQEHNCSTCGHFRRTNFNDPHIEDHLTCHNPAGRKACGIKSAYDSDWISIEEYKITNKSW